MTKKDKEMAGREKLIASQESDEGLILNISLRPSNLTDFIGQKELVENLKVSLEAAKKRAEPMEHTLLSGPPGLGKTSLAHIIAHEMGTKITATSGPANRATRSSSSRGSTPSTSRKSIPVSSAIPTTAATPPYWQISSS